MVFKRQLTPLRPHGRGRRGQIFKQRGKGSIQQDQPPPGGETVTGAAPLQRMMNQYPKPTPSPVPQGPPPVQPAGSPQPTGPVDLGDTD